MRAAEWYREFCAAYKKDLKMRALENKKHLSDSGWTKGMAGFLRGLAESLDYEVIPEHGVVGKGRIDHQWSKQGSTIAIEHENWWKGVSSEIKKLCEFNSDLSRSSPTGRA